jgi:hypothetical protein
LLFSEVRSICLIDGVFEDEPKHCLAEFHCGDIIWLSSCLQDKDWRICHVERSESSESRNCEDQQKGSQERYSGNWKVEHLAEEDRGGFEEKNGCA